jgi:hypothetical protein
MAHGRIYSGTPDLAPAADNVLNITSTSQQYTLPVCGAEYIIKASGGSVMLKEGSNPTAVYPVTTEDGMLIMEGETTEPMRLTGPKIAYIGPSTASGWVQFIRMKRN